MKLQTAAEPFRFHSRSSLTISANRQAKNIKELLNHLEHIPDTVIYQHTHHFLLQHQYLVPEPPNDFAYWVGEVLKEERLSEQLAAVDTTKFDSLSALRGKFVQILTAHISKNPQTHDAPEGSEFYFLRSVVFVMPTGKVAWDLKGFMDCLLSSSYNSLYHHIFEAKLRIPSGENDFSRWLDTALNETELAENIMKLNPYSHTLGGIKRRICSLIETRLQDKK